MKMEMNFELIENANEKINLGVQLINKLEMYEDINGIEKIEKKIRQEIKFLEKNLKAGKLRITHVKSSNLVHFEFLLEILEQQRHLVHVEHGFYMANRTKPLKVDIVCEHGLLWVRAIARNPKALADAVKGYGNYGDKDIIEQAEEYLNAAKQNCFMFTPPKVLFYFSQNIDSIILNELKKIGVLVAVRNEVNFSNILNYFPDITVLNLDTTTLIAYVSELCNGGCYHKFREAIISEQADIEKQYPIKAQLDKFFENKQLICCQEAIDAFKKILDTLSGHKEMQRAKEFMSCIQIMPNVSDIPKELLAINSHAKVNERTLKVIAFGLQMKAITVTANKSFVRSARQQGLQFPVFLHQSRALTEKKALQ